MKINENNEIINDSESKQQPTQKEQAILSAAIKLFSKFGYTGTTTMSIAQEAGVSEKTLFKYFGTKQELYNRVLYPSIIPLIKQKVTEEKQDDRGMYGMLNDLFISKTKLANDNPDLLKLTIHEFLMNPEFRAAMSKIWYEIYLPSLSSQLELSEEKKCKYNKIFEGGFTRAITSLLFAYLIDKSYIHPEKEFNDEKEIEFMLDILFNGINGIKI